MPTLIQNYKKKEVETRLKRVYSVMNQAITLSEVQNGDKSGWTYYFLNSGEDDNAHNLEWYEKYLKPYLKTLKVEVEESTNYIDIYFEDGSLLVMRRGGTTYMFLPNAAKYTGKYRGKTASEYLSSKDIYGKDMFLFALNPSPIEDGWQYHKNKGFEPYKWIPPPLVDFKDYGAYACDEDGSKLYCTALIQENNWEIPDDYPIKF